MHFNISGLVFIFLTVCLGAALQLPHDFVAAGANLRKALKLIIAAEICYRRAGASRLCVFTAAWINLWSPQMLTCAAFSSTGTIRHIWLEPLGLDRLKGCSSLPCLCLCVDDCIWEGSGVLLCVGVADGLSGSLGAACRLRISRLIVFFYCCLMTVMFKTKVWWAKTRFIWQTNNGHLWNINADPTSASDLESL